jgi:hypothetical protein
VGPTSEGDSACLAIGKTLAFGPTQNRLNGSFREEQ